jgi:hypothetical protein
MTAVGCAHSGSVTQCLKPQLNPTSQQSRISKSMELHFHLCWPARHASSPNRLPTILSHQSWRRVGRVPQGISTSSCCPLGGGGCDSPPCALELCLLLGFSTRFRHWSSVDVRRAVTRRQRGTSTVHAHTHTLSLYEGLVLHTAPRGLLDINQPPQPRLSSQMRARRGRRAATQRLQTPAGGDAVTCSPQTLPREVAVP